MEGLVLFTKLDKRRHKRNEATVSRFAIPKVIGIKELQKLGFNVNYGEGGSRRGRGITNTRYP